MPKFFGGGGDEPEPSNEIEREELEGLKSDSPTFLKIPVERAAKAVRAFWNRQKRAAEEMQAALKVNKLRHDGQPWAMVDPENNREVYLPSEAVGSTLPPVLNRIERACDRYAAQLTADDPVLEGVPQSHEDEDRDAAEATSHIIAGEFERARLRVHLKRGVRMSTVYRSAFTLVDWDPTEGGKVPAQKYMPTEDAKGATRHELRYIRREKGQDVVVDSPDEATPIWQGNLTYELGSPMNVRWRGSRTAHSATELVWGKLVALRDLFVVFPDLRKEKVGDLLANVPVDAEEYLQDLRGESELTYSEPKDSEAELVGDELDGDHEELLDRPALVLRYFHKPDRQYEEGADVIVVGKLVASRRTLRWGRIPVAQVRCLDSLTDKYGRGLVDVVKDAHQLLDFVNVSVLQLLRVASRRRYFLQYGTMVSTKELQNPENSVIYYNGTNTPVPEQAGEVPNSVVQFVDRFRADFDDMTGIHETMQGKHVPGVSSGRHAEALRTGDETLLGLTRAEIEEYLVALGRIMIAAVKKEWTQPRKIRYLRADRAYVEKHFSGADIGGTTDVILKKGTLLMLTPAQKIETIYGLAQMGFIRPDELRRLAPLTDTAGISLSEDAHYIRARRITDRYLEGPPEALEASFMQFEQAAAKIDQHVQYTNQLSAAVPATFLGRLEERLMMLESELADMEMAWQQELGKYSPVPELIDQDPIVASVVYEECARALASEKAETLPAWWSEPFRQYSSIVGMVSGRLPPPAPPPGAEAVEPEAEGSGGDQPAGPESAGVAQESAPPGLDQQAALFAPHETGSAP